MSPFYKETISLAVTLPEARKGCYPFLKVFIRSQASSKEADI
jgi:hypothetical protein